MTAVDTKAAALIGQAIKVEKARRENYPSAENHLTVAYDADLSTALACATRSVGFTPDASDWRTVYRGYVGDNYWCIVMEKPVKE